MACLRGLVNRSNLLRPRRHHQAFAYVIHDDDRNCLSSPKESPPEKRGIGSRGVFDSAPPLLGAAAYRFSSSVSYPLGAGAGACFGRYMSTASAGGGAMAEEGFDVANVLTDGADALANVAAAQAPALSEVAVAAADSYFPVAALQYLIDSVHTFTGLDWWAAIILTTLLIRGATVPLLINQVKATHKLAILKPHLEEIRGKMQDQGLPMAEGQEQMKKLFTQHGVTPFTPLKGLLIQGPIFVSFFLAISNMAEKVPSMKTGGAYWFVDLTTPDSLYIFPVLTALTFWITVECNAQEGMEGNAHAGTMKNISRVLAAGSIPLTMSFPKAIFCYWITSNFFSLTYGLVLKSPAVKNILGLPKLPAPQPTTTSPKPSLNLFETLRQVKEASKQRAESLASSSSSPSSSSSSSSLNSVKSSDRVSSSSVLNQRIKSLEKQVKGKKKNKKR